MKPYFYNKRKLKTWAKRHQPLIYGFLVGIMLGSLIGYFLEFKPAPVEMISPCPKTGCEVPKPTPTPVSHQSTSEPEAPKTPPLVGLASYYSETGCLGCSPTLTMANGQRLDDTQMTVAYNHAPLNTTISITNTKTNKTVQAKVTDRGGFERHGKIVDLSVATKEALGCGDVCHVSIEL